LQESILRVNLSNVPCRDKNGILILSNVPCCDKNGMLILSNVPCRDKNGGQFYQMPLAVIKK
jgi:hypothetical protein